MLTASWLHASSKLAVIIGTVLFLKYSILIYRRCHEETSYVSNYVFITSSHEWVDRGQMHQLEKLLCV